MFIAPPTFLSLVPISSKFAMPFFYPFPPAFPSLGLFFFYALEADPKLLSQTLEGGGLVAVPRAVVNGAVQAGGRRRHEAPCNHLVRAK